MNSPIKLTCWKIREQADVLVDPEQFLEALRKEEVHSHYDGIKDDGTIFAEHYCTGDYVNVAKATPRQLAIHNAIGDLLVALRMEK